MSIPKPSDVARALALLENAERPEFDLTGLLANARNRMALAPAAEVRKDDILEAGDPQSVNELVALADQYFREAKAATAARDQIKDLLRELVGAHDGISVHGAVVFTNKVVKSRVLDQAAVKNEFPDVPGNERFWTTTQSRRAEFK